MYYYELKPYKMKISAIALGCMNFGGHWDGCDDPATLDQRAERAWLTALDAGINFFDHADIYAGGASESQFARLLKLRPGIREQIYIQSKCAVRWDDPISFDNSTQHIRQSVDATLRRLDVESLDVLLLHWPDILLQPEEVAKVFQKLKQSGKVAHFGVSNFTASRMQLLNRYLDEPLFTNQLNISLTSTALFDDVVSFSSTITRSQTEFNGILDFAMQYKTILQAWSPLTGGAAFTKTPEPCYRRLSVAVATMAAEKQVSPEAIAIAWLLRHPAQIQPIIGSRTPERIIAACQGCSVKLTSAEWYLLYRESRQSELLK
jgi:predicted oxidoreductase